MLEKSKNHNPNYLAKVVALKNLKKHPNADRLQVVDIDFQQVITGIDSKEGDVYVFFPVESKISKEFLSFTNSFRDSTLNQDPEKKGFFEEKGRVKAVKLRGEKSMGYIVPSHHVAAWSRVDIFPNDVGTEFDTIGGKLLVEKYVVKTKEPRDSKQGKKPKLSRLIDGQVHLHIDTENLRKNAHKISPDDYISITYKTHGTSWWVGNVKVKKHLNWFQKLGKKLGIDIVDTEYDLVYGSRRVVKNSSLEDPKAKDHYFGYDLWEKIKDEIGDKIPKGYTLYGEFLGFDHNGSYIQKGFDYGCTPNGDPQHKLEVYRITQTNEDGLVTELDLIDREEFCARVGLETPKLFYYGQAKDWLYMNMLDIPTIDSQEEFSKLFVQQLEKEFNEKDCFMCVEKVPEEGVIVRKESLFNCESYKLKSFRFLEWESKDLDSGEPDVESLN